MHVLLEMELERELHSVSSESASEHKGPKNGFPRPNSPSLLARLRGKPVGEIELVRFLCPVESAFSHKQRPVPFQALAPMPPNYTQNNTVPINTAAEDDVIGSALAETP